MTAPRLTTEALASRLAVVAALCCACGGVVTAGTGGQEVDDGAGTSVGDDGAGTSTGGPDLPAPDPATGDAGDDEAVEIHTIQGKGLRSSFAPATGNGAGSMVLTADNVVTAVLDDGFMIQTPDVRVDAEMATSQGIFVFTAAAPVDVAVGDVVTVWGTVTEFFDFTQLTDPVIVHEASGAALPAAIEWNEQLPSPDPGHLSCGQTLGNFECFEGMRVTVPVGVAATGNQSFGGDPYAEIYAVATGERSRREEGVRFGLGATNGQPVWDGNPEVFELDADRILAANADRVIRGGSRLRVDGVVGYEFGNHELWPTELTVVDDIERSVRSASPSELTVASFNLLRLCATDVCNAQNGRPVALTAQEIAAKVARLSLYVRDVLRAPAVCGVQEVETLALLEQLAQKIAADGGPSYSAHLIEGNDASGIDNGFLVRTDLVEDVQLRQLGKDELLTDPADCSEGEAPCILHDRPPLLLRAAFVHGGDELPFAVLNNHTRSRGSLDTGVKTARVRAKRFAQASSIATYVQRFQTGVELDPAAPTGDVATAEVPLLLVGDYNAFEVTDGWVDVVGLIAGSYDDSKNELQLGGQIVAPPLLQTSSLIPLEARYSCTFVDNFDAVQAQDPRRVGSAQILDHGFASAAAQPLVKGMQYARLNADAPAALRTGTGAEGCSDHDGFVIFVETAK